MSTEDEALGQVDALLAANPEIVDVRTETPINRRARVKSRQLEFLAEEGELRFTGTVVEHNGDLDAIMPAIAKANEGVEGDARFVEADNYIQVRSRLPLPASSSDIDAWMKRGITLATSPAASSLNVNYGSDS